MGMQIIKQPDGRFAVRSSETDTIIIWDATREEIIGWFADRAAASAREHTQRLIGHVEAGQPEAAYFQFVVPWEKALADDRKHDGEAWQAFR